jgi:hypothetical protein
MVQVNVLTEFVKSEPFFVCKFLEFAECCHGSLKARKENGLQRAILAPTEVHKDIELQPDIQVLKRV